MSEHVSALPGLRVRQDPAAAAVPPKSEVLPEEIRDLLAEKPA